MDFYIAKKKANSSIAIKSDSAFQNIPAITVTGIKSRNVSPQPLALSPLREKTGNKKKSDFEIPKTAPVVIPITIDPPKEPFNKKARVAIIFLVLAKLVMIAAFIFLLCSLLIPFYLLTGIAALFALLALVFGLWAKKEINAQEPYEREPGGKEAGEVVARAVGGIASAGFIILLAVIIEWIRRRNGR